ncbi:putative clathrin assembly protein isoform X1 [Salvia divinorum]|uniref:Clathrin assembly protein isoform X1 n=1 Tax=Salvia divinorum TaxID=28513 RepID=A0ABD1II69_SALDI
MDSFRKAYGALKDSTKVGLAKVNSDFKDLDIAIVKATNHVESPPKERHVRSIFAAVSLASPRADVGYCIHALSKRLSKTRSWIVAIKTLIVFHRIFREGDKSFKEELVHISRRGNIFQISRFKDDSSALAWDCSSWIRSYAMFLEERLECFRTLNLDLDSSERGVTNRSSSSQTKEHSRMSDVEQLLEQLPALQELMYRLVCCQPEGPARYNYLVQYALALVVKESFKVYCTINDGIIVLVDKYFDMPHPLAVVALSVYKKAGRQADHLSDFYDVCKTLDLARTFQFPILRQPPSSFLQTMEDYVKEVSPSHRMEQRRKEEVQKSEEAAAAARENGKQDGIKALVVVAQQTPAEQPVDLLGLNEPSPIVTQPEETNPLALAICQNGNEQAETSHPSSDCGWELALVTTPSSTNSPQTKVGGFDRMMLDRLYEDSVSRRRLQLHRAGYSTDPYGYGVSPQNLFEQRDPFAVSPQADAQLVGMPPQQQMAMQQQQQYHMMMQQQQQQQQQYHMMMQQQQYQMMMMATYNQNQYISPYPQQQQERQMQQTGSMNPFGEPFSYPQSSNHTLF